MEKHSIPQSLEVEHKELHEQLKKAIDSGGKTGDAAKGVAELLHPHFEKEEEYAMPPLGLLSLLSRESRQGEDRGAEMTTTKDTQQKILAKTDKLKEDLPNMLEEHKQIVGALENLIYAAKQENKSEYSHFAEKLKLHAQTEEEVLYPAAILVGQYLKLKSAG